MTPKRSRLTSEDVFGQFELKFQGSDGDLFATLRKPNPHVKRAGDFLKEVTDELKWVAFGLPWDAYSET